MEISSTKLVELVILVHRQGEIGRTPERDVVALIRKSIDAGLIEKQGLHENLSKRVSQN